MLQRQATRSTRFVAAVFPELTDAGRASRLSQRQFEVLMTVMATVVFSKRPQRDRDARIARVGVWIRRMPQLDLDELPQLRHALWGGRSFVGPRPLIPAEDEGVTNCAHRQLDLVPGITGYRQVLGGHGFRSRKMQKLYHRYVMNWSLWEDIRPILRTLPVVLAGQGAN